MPSCILLTTISSHFVPSKHKLPLYSKPTHIIQCVHDQAEPLDPLEVIHTILDIPVPSVDVDARVGVEVVSCRSGNKGFGFRDVGFSEEELAVQV